MIEVYSQVDGFPNESEQPEYYRMLRLIGKFTEKPDTALLVAVSEEKKVLGAVVYIDDMKFYGSGGTASKEKNASGFRLLAVDPAIRRQGIGRLLADECVKKARERKHHQLIIHSTMAMRNTWQMYHNMGFKRSEDLDFMQGNLPVFGFRLLL